MAEKRRAPAKGIPIPAIATNAAALLLERFRRDTNQLGADVIAQMQEHGELEGDGWTVHFDAGVVLPTPAAAPAHSPAAPPKTLHPGKAFHGKK